PCTMDEPVTKTQTDRFFVEARRAMLYHELHLQGFYSHEEGDFCDDKTSATTCALVLRGAGAALYRLCAIRFLSSRDGDGKELGNLSIAERHKSDYPSGDPGRGGHG